MGETFLDRHGIKSGIKLNDVIEEYRYVANGKSVKKGDFLTYVGEDVAPAIEPPFNAIALSSGVGGTETEHNEQVKITRLPIEIAKAGNIFPTSWTEESTTKIVASDGTILTASSYNSSGYMLSYACDNKTDTTWKSGDYGTAWLKIKLPAARKITKMKYYAYPNNGDINVIIQGSNDDSKWDDLYTTSEKQNSLIERTLNNPDYYQYYKLVIECSTYAMAFVYEWQTSEYVEVI